MSENAAKLREIYLDHPKDISKTTCIIHGPGHSSYEYKILGDFSSKYSKNNSTKDCGHYPVNRKKFNRNQDNNTIFLNAYDETLPK